MIARIAKIIYPQNSNMTTNQAEQSDRECLRRLQRLRTEPGVWALRKDGNVLAAITLDGWDILHLEASARTNACAKELVSILNRKR